MNILGVELELDLFDADVIEVYEKENKGLLTESRITDGMRESPQRNQSGTSAEL